MLKNKHVMALCGGMHYIEGGGHKPPPCRLGLNVEVEKFSGKLFCVGQKISLFHAALLPSTKRNNQPPTGPLA